MSEFYELLQFLFLNTQICFHVNISSSNELIIDPYTALLFYIGYPDHETSLKTQGNITSPDLGAEMSDNVFRGKRKRERKLSI